MKMSLELENASVDEIREWLISNDYVGVNRIPKKEIISGYFAARIRGYQDYDYFLTENVGAGYNFGPMQ